MVPRLWPESMACASRPKANLAIARFQGKHVAKELIAGRAR